MLKNLIYKPKITIISFLCATLIFLFLPYDFKLKLSIVLAGETLFLWGISALDNALISAGFLISAAFFSLASLKTIFYFPFTENFYLIILSYIITKGVTDTGVASVFSKNIMGKIVKSPLKLIIFSYIAGFILIFFIPQPFPRVILLAAFYTEFFKNQNINDKSKEILYFSIFTASTFTSMFFLSGDMLLNYVVVALSKANLNWTEWALYMSVPTIFICLFTFIIFIILFRKEIKSCSFNNLVFNKSDGKLTKEQRKMLLVCTVIFLGFIFQGYHNLKASYIMFIGVVLGFILKVLDFKSFKNINWKLLVFFTGAFSVGGVLNESGAANIIVEFLMKLMPTGDYNSKIIFLIVVTLILNFFLGSAVTTSSVVIPTISCLGILPPQSAVLALFVYTVVSVQYIMPFHHATIMVGFGEGLYKGGVICKYGIFLTVLTFFIVLYACLPWWRFVGII